MINDSYCCYFACSHGVRQGDLLSCLLFGLAEDYLSCLLTSLINSKDLVSIAATREVTVPTHILYVDDVLLFCKASLCNICCISDTFATYAELSGQFFNWEKSCLYLGPNVSRAGCQSFLYLSDLKWGFLPFVYLGILLFWGASTISHLFPIADRILGQLESWKEHLLSFSSYYVWLTPWLLQSLFIPSWSITGR